jgi:uncharacterized membrane protein YfcA
LRHSGVILYNNPVYSVTLSHAGLLFCLLAVGSAGGFLSGLLGVGGGIIFVPTLYYILTFFGIEAGHAMRIAVGTSLALVLATGASSAYWHYKKGSIDFSILKSWSPAIVLGVAAGTFLAAAVNGAFLKQFFAVMTLLLSFYMFFSHELKIEPATHRLSKGIQRIGAALIGMVAALIGIGGAILSIPFMTYIGVPMRKSVGTGGALGCLIAVPAVTGYIFSGLPHAAELPSYSLGYVNLLAVAVILPVSMLLSPVGVHVSHRLPMNFLRRIFAVVLVFVSLAMFFR